MSILCVGTCSDAAVLDVPPVLGPLGAARSHCRGGASRNAVAVRTRPTVRAGSVTVTARISQRSRTAMSPVRPISWRGSQARAFSIATGPLL